MGFFKLKIQIGIDDFKSSGSRDRPRLPLDRVSFFREVSGVNWKISHGKNSCAVIDKTNLRGPTGQKVIEFILSLYLSLYLC